MDCGAAIDDLIVMCNELPKCLMTGEYVNFCRYILMMVQGLSDLKQGLGGDKGVSDRPE